MTGNYFCLCFLRSVKRTQAMRGRNLPRDNRTKEVSLDTSLEDFNSSRLFLFRQDTDPPSPPQGAFLPCLKKSRGLGQSPGGKTKNYFSSFNWSRSKSPSVARPSGYAVGGRCSREKTRPDSRGNRVRLRNPSGTPPPASPSATSVRP